MTNLRIHIRTPSRLHFGLLGWGPQAGRQFGGVGLMIDSPGLDLVVEPASSWIVEGPRASRIEQLIAHLRVTMAEAGMTVRPAHIRVESVPPEHIGLGVGTQLCLAVARAVSRVAGKTDVSVEQLARWTGRGRRSGIGLHGFEHGGLIVDGGRRNEADIPPLLARVPFPEAWSILIVRPPGESGLHGPEENRAFANLPPITRDVTDSLCRLVLLEILPAVIERDLEAFGRRTLGELGYGSRKSPPVSLRLKGGYTRRMKPRGSLTSCARSGSSASVRASWGLDSFMPFRLARSQKSPGPGRAVSAAGSGSTKPPFSGQRRPTTGARFLFDQ